MLPPQLLDKAEPNFNFDDSGQILRFRVLYDYLDDSIMPRFIVAVHQDIDSGIQWRKGVLLHNQRLNSSALVKVNYQDKLLSIEVNGEQKRDYFAAIRHDLQKIHDSFEWQKKSIELVLLPDNPDYTVEYEELIGYELDGDDNYRVGKLRKVYSVSELLNGIEKPEQRRHSSIYVNSDYVQEKKVAEINQTGNNVKLTPQLEELYQLLKAIEAGQQSFKPNTDGIDALKDFQSTMRCLKEAERRKYIIGKVDDITSNMPESYGMTLMAMINGGLRYEGIEVLNNPKQLIINNHPEASVDMRTINTKNYAENNSGNMAGRDIVYSGNQENDEIKLLLAELLKQIKELNDKVPTEQNQVIASMNRDAEDLDNEINSDNPRQRNSLFSLDGIKDAATQLGETATPIMDIAEKISPFLQILS